jgi:uncharacterized membrane protein
MKVFGHPLHMMLIHFPTALLPMDILLSFFAYYTEDNSFLTAGFYCLAAGVISGLLAIVTGLIDGLFISKDSKEAIATAMIHGFINGTVLLFFGIFAYRSWQLYPALNMPSLSILLLKTGLVISLFVGNYLGGKLILHHHIGIKNRSN